MNTDVRTVSDTKRSFYAHHKRPINSIYRRVVEEMMVEMHLLSVNVDFKYDPIYALGIVTTFDRFMQGYIPEQDKTSIFTALCQSVEASPEQYRQDAAQLEASVEGMSLDDFNRQLPGAEEAGSGALGGYFQTIANDPNYKYSRLLAIGLYTLLEKIAPEAIADDNQRKDLIKQVCTALGFSDEKMQKDLDLYRSNLDKLAQAQEVMRDILEADRKQREERVKRLQEKQPPNGETGITESTEESENTPKSTEAG